MLPPSPVLVPRNQGCCPGGKKNVSAPVRHFIAKQPLEVASGVHANEIIVRLAIVMNTTETTDVKEVSPHISADFRNLRRCAALSRKPWPIPLVQQIASGKSSDPPSLDNTAHGVIARFKQDTFNRVAIPPLIVKP